MTEVEQTLSEVHIDPVCGMKVLPEKAAGTTEHGGKTWYFCGKGCLAKFEADPAKYDGTLPRVVAAKPAASAASGRGGYICPMDPEVWSDKPADCPKCGMALEAASPGRTVVQSPVPCTRRS